MSDGIQGEQGPQGPSGPQGIMGEGRRGERGATGPTGDIGEAGHEGARGQTGKAGSRTKLPRRVFAAFLAVTVAATVALYLGFASLQEVKHQAAAVERQAAANDRLAAKTIDALRDGCEAVNVLRVNQGLGISEQVEQAKQALKGPLGPLEQFRQQGEDSIRRREARLRELRASVTDYPLTDEQAKAHPKAERPYRADCFRAFP
jgi:4-amino-4-deoxy-L-arabinose transferase-like glycosyltransferase